MGVDEEPTKLPTTVQGASEGEAKRTDAAKDQLENTDATGKAMLESVAQRRTGFLVFFKDVRHALKLDEMGREIARIAVPAALALAADPLASLVDTAFIGRIGAIELAAVGVSIAIFNQVSKIAIYPIVSVTTSFVAEEHAAYAVGISGEENEDTEKASAVIDSKMGYSPSFVDNDTTARRFRYKRIHIPSVSSALVVGGVLGFLQAILLIFAAKPFLLIMGVKPGSPMLIPALRYLSLRALGAPAVLLSLAMQGVFRGFKDTKTPLYAIVAGDVTNTILDAILILVLHLGVTGAAIAHVISQYLISGILFLRLISRVKIMPSKIKDLKFSRFLTCVVHILSYCTAHVALEFLHVGATLWRNMEKQYMNRGT